MPELPEVETVRRGLDAHLRGATVVEVVATGRRSLRRYDDPSSFAALVRGRVLGPWGRHGKYLIGSLGPAPASLVVHLRMSGQLRLVPASAPVVAHTHVVLRLDDGRELRFVDPRTFGEMFVSTPTPPELATLGPDALGISRVSLEEVLRSRARLKPLLLDQRAIAGIGNIYSDEILWRARLRWSRPASSLRPVEVTRLHEAIGAVLEGAVAARGSSLRDRRYVDLAGEGGEYQLEHAVYDRLGQPCPRCGRPIERTQVAQRSHYWCRRCQR